MVGIVTRTGRLLWEHWPALLAWFLAGTLGHFVLLRLASLVGAATAVGGILLLPMAALALLVAYVAMLLVLRDGMPALRERAPLPAGGAERRAAFLNALLGGILPFVAFYAAWGFIREDVAAYINGAYEWQFAWGLYAVAEGTDYDTAGTIDDLGVNALTIGIVVVAFAGRWAYKRFGARLPKWTGVIALYLEALWIYLAAYIIADLLGTVSAWVQSRQAMVWLADLRGALTGIFAPIGFLWDGVAWLLGEAGGVILLPVAWLTIAGVVYGQAVKATAPELSGTVITRVRSRYGTLPQQVRRRLGEIWESITSRFRPIGRALLLMWRAGPVLIGGYVLLLTVIELGEQWLLVGMSRAIGPQELQAFWFPASVGLVMVVALVAETIRIALIAATYDATLGVLAPGSPVDGEAEVDPVAAEDSGQLDDERAGGVVAEHDGVDEVVRRDDL